MQTLAFSNPSTPFIKLLVRKILPLFLHLFLLMYYVRKINSEITCFLVKDHKNLATFSASCFEFHYLKNFMSILSYANVSIIQRN